MPRKKASFAFYAGMGISLVFILYAVFKIDLQKAAGVFWSVKPLWLIPIVVTQVFIFYFRALRWREILEPVKRVPTMTLFSTLYIGFMGNMIFPMRMGELIRIYLISKKESIPKSGVFATLVLERTFDFLGMITLLFFVILFVDPTNVKFEIWRNLNIVGSVMVVGVTTSFILFYFMVDNNSVLNRFFNALAKNLLPEMIAGKLANFFESFRNGLTVLQKGRRIFAILAYNAAVWVCIITFYCLYLPMFGMAFSAEVGAVMTLFIVLGAILPSSPAFVGPFHAAIVIALGFYGVPAGEALGIAILMHIAWFVSTVSIGLFFLSREKMTLSEIRRSAD